MFARRKSKAQSTKNNLIPVTSASKSVLRETPTAQESRRRHSTRLTHRSPPRPGKLQNEVIKLRRNSCQRHKPQGKVA